MTAIGIIKNGTHCRFFLISFSFPQSYYFFRMRALSQPSVTHVFFLELIKSTGAVQAMMCTNR